MVLRRITFPLRLVGARLAAGGERLALVALGIVAGAAVLAAVLAGRLVMQDRALQLAVGQLQPGDRTVQVVWSGAVTSFSQLDPTGHAEECARSPASNRSPRCCFAKRRSNGAS